VARPIHTSTRNEGLDLKSLVRVQNAAQLISASERGRGGPRTTSPRPSVGEFDRRKLQPSRVQLLRACPRVDAGRAEFPPPGRNEWRSAARYHRRAGGITTAWIRWSSAKAIHLAIHSFRGASIPRTISAYRLGGVMMLLACE